MRTTATRSEDDGRAYRGQICRLDEAETISEEIEDRSGIVSSVIFPRRLTPAEAETFSLRHGIYIHEQTRAGLRLCQITPRPEGRFTTGGPILAYTLMTSPDPYAADIVAFHPARPTVWRTMDGAAWLYGRGCEALRYEECGAVRLWRDPMSWMLHGGVGAVMLSSLAAADLTSGLDIEAEDGEHAQEIRRAIWRTRARVSAAS